MWQHIPRELPEGNEPVMFYGVRPAWLHLWQQAKAEGRDWYYADNSYFDAAREGHFRVCRNRLQHAGTGHSDGSRARSLGVEIKPWTLRGQHIVICVQSDEFLRVVAGIDGGAAAWQWRVERRIAQYTKRPVIVRTKGTSRPLASDLIDAWAVVTHSSAAANEALIAGIPAFVTGECAASPVAAGDLADIENPRRPDGREQWAGVLCDAMWTLDEFREGKAWQALA